MEKKGCLFILKCPQGLSSGSILHSTCQEGAGSLNLLVSLSSQSLFRRQEKARQKYTLLCLITTESVFPSWKNALIVHKTQNIG
jgi:hypothetical protein